MQKNLVNKLVTVMSSVSKIVKTGHNSHQNYAYVTEADVLEAIRAELCKNKIFIFSSVENTTLENQVTTVTVLHTFIDAESGETFQVKSSGSGWDKTDKGVYKAITGAMKYFLMKNFLLPSGEDPEKDEKEVSTNKPTTVSRFNKSKTEEAPKVAAEVDTETISIKRTGFSKRLVKTEPNFP